MCLAVFFSINAKKPNFYDAEFDVIRNIFKDDIASLYLLLSQNNVSDDFIDKPALQRFLDSSQG